MTRTLIPAAALFGISLLGMLQWGWLTNWDNALKMGVMLFNGILIGACLVISFKDGDKHHDQTR